MSDCKGCKYWTRAIDAYADGRATSEEPHPFCSTCEGDKYQRKGAKITKASLSVENNVLRAENDRLRAELSGCVYHLEEALIEEENGKDDIVRVAGYAAAIQSAKVLLKGR